MLAQNMFQGKGRSTHCLLVKNICVLQTEEARSKMLKEIKKCICRLSEIHSVVVEKEKNEWGRYILSVNMLTSLVQNLGERQKAAAVQGGSCQQGAKRQRGFFFFSISFTDRSLTEGVIFQRKTKKSLCPPPTLLLPPPIGIHVLQIGLADKEARKQSSARAIRDWCFNHSSL